MSGQILSIVPERIHFCWNDEVGEKAVEAALWRLFEFRIFFYDKEIIAHQIDEWLTKPLA